MVALPGLTSICLTKEWTKALVSVSSLVLRNSLISSAKVAMVSALSSITRRSASRAPRFLSGDLQLLLALPVLPDAVRGVGHLDVRRLNGVPDAAQPTLRVSVEPEEGPSTCASGSQEEGAAGFGAPCASVCTPLMLPRIWIEPPCVSESTKIDYKYPRSYTFVVGYRFS